MNWKENSEEKGLIEINRTEEGDRIIYQYSWIGGPVVVLSLDFIRDTHDLHWSGSRLFVGPFILTMEGISDGGNIIARRLEDES